MWALCEYADRRRPGVGAKPHRLSTKFCRGQRPVRRVSANEVDERARPAQRTVDAHPSLLPGHFFTQREDFLIGYLPPRPHHGGWLARPVHQDRTGLGRLGRQVDTRCQHGMILSR